MPGRHFCDFGMVADFFRPDHIPDTRELVPRVLAWNPEQKMRQTACKPGSVPGLLRAMAIPLGRPLPDASRDLPGRLSGNGLRAVPIWSCSRWGLPCRVRCRPRGALLPHRFTLAARRDRSLRCEAVCFLWRYPWGRPRRTLSGTVFPWSPDFPPDRALRRSRAAIRPSDAFVRLAQCARHGERAILNP